jgi:LCP family protein required for cell wall assembly
VISIAGLISFLDTLDGCSIRSIPVSTEPRSKPQSTRGQRILIGTAIAIFAAVAAYLALVIITRVDSIFFPGNQLAIADIPVVGEAPLPGVDTEGTSGNQDPINILVIGLDRRPAEGSEPTRTDTIFVLHVDPKANTSTIVGFPRDLVVDIPGTEGGVYEDRINSAYVAGELTDYSGGGVGLMKEVFYDNFNIKIDKYVIIDFVGFEELIDALGGIDIDVTNPVYDPYYSHTELPGDYYPVEWDVGVHHMNGMDALAYARVRFSGDDLDRIYRQQQVIFAALEKAKSLNLLDVGKARELWSKYNDTVETDVNDALIPGYALLANQVKDDLQAVSIGPATAACTGPGGAAWLCWDEEAVAAIVDSVFYTTSGTTVTLPTVTAEPVRVQVQNGTGSEGLAARVVRYIAAQGYPVDDLNAANTGDSLTHEISEIIDLDGTHEQQRLLLSKWLDVDLDNVRPGTADDATVYAGVDADILIILGTDVDYDTLIESDSTGTTDGG